MIEERLFLGIMYERFFFFLFSDRAVVFWVQILMVRQLWGCGSTAG